jgi:hypothetical protein
MALPQTLKRAEEALRASEAGLRLIVDTIPGLVSTMNTAGEPQLFNRQLVEYFGRTREELKSWTTNDLVHPDDLARVTTDSRGAIEAGQPYDFEVRIRRADGVYRWFQVRNHPVRDAEGRVISWHTLLTDIDERKRAEDRLQLLFDITNQVVSNLQLRDLLRAIAASVPALCNAIWWASSCRTWTGTGCKPSRSIFRRAKDSFERITVRWRGRLVVLSSALASPG